MKVETKPIEEVLPYGKNPRRNQKAVDAVASSLKQFGWKQPIVVDANNVIIVGHTRYLAAQKLGMAKVPVVVAKDLSAEQVKAYRIADNKTNELAEWDVGLLSAELRELSDAGWNNLGDLAFSQNELDGLLSPLAAQTFQPERPTVSTAVSEQYEKDDAESEPGELQAGKQEVRNYLEEEIEDDEEPEEPNVEQDSITTYREDAIFSSSNWLGFPDLLPHMLWDGDIRKVYIKDGDEAPVQMICWSSVGVDERMRGHVINFYASDDRFDTAIWEKSANFMDKMRVIKPEALVMPDFSTWADEPAAFNIWNTYRARWCSRYWQEAGHKVIPNINIADEASWQWIFIGIPPEVPCAMVQCRTYKNDEKGRQLFCRGMHQWCSKIKTAKIIIYGGENRSWLEPNLPKGPQYIWFDSYHKSRKDAGLF
jgi:hypothetical protein